jgi:hypothetical protein
MATTTYSYTVSRTTTVTTTTTVNRAPGPPPIRILGYFTGCPAPALPVCRVPMPILRLVAARCCVTNPFLPLTRWFVVPPMRFIYPPVFVFRR